MKRAYLLLLLIFFWVGRNTIFVRQRDIDSFASVDTMALFQIVAIFLLFSSFFFLYRKVSSRTLNNIYKAPVLWLFLLYALGLISAFWSPFFNYSAYRAFESLVLFFAVFVYFNNIVDFEKSEKAFLRFILTLLLLTFFGYWKLIGFQISIAAVHTNSYSFIGLILFLYSIGELLSRGEKSRKRKKMLKRYMYIGLFFVVLGTSSATNISVVFGLILLALFTNRKDVQISVLILLTLSLPIFFTFGDISQIQEILFPGKDINSITMMTGRVVMWTEYIEMIYEHPYFGWGFSVLSRIAEHARTNAHNSILSILSGMGMAGGIIFIIFLVRSSFSIFKNRNRKMKGSVGGGIAFAAALMNSMSISIIGEGAAPATLSFVVLLAFYFLNVNGRHQQYQKYSKVIS